MSSLDSGLRKCLQTMCSRDWAAARDLLSQRLERCSVLGYRRTTLFLLSIAATSSGYEDIGQQLWQQARDCEAQFDEPRSLVVALEIADDPQAEEILTGLQAAWQQFNGWGRQNSLLTSDRAPTNLESADWSRFTLLLEHGQATALEQEFGELLLPPTPSCRWLWNLIALCHLDGGDLRSYQEMCESAPKSNELPVPAQLLQELERSSLKGLIADLQGESWITAGLRSFQDANHGPEQSDIEELGVPQNTWEESFQSALRPLRLQSYGEAALLLQRLADQSETDHQKAYALNALTLALFAQGLYVEAEEVNSELGLLQQKPLQLRDQSWSDDYRILLEDLGFSPLPDCDLINPFSAFHGAHAPEPPESLGERAQEADDFLSDLTEALHLLESFDQERFRRALLKISRKLSAHKTTQHAIILFLLARSCLSEGDQYGGQEFCQDLQAQFTGEKLDLEVARAAAECFLAAGQPDLGRLFRNLPSVEIALALDPWQDLSVTP